MNVASVVGIVFAWPQPRPAIDIVFAVAAG